MHELIPSSVVSKSSIYNNKLELREESILRNIRISSHVSQPFAAVGWEFLADK